MGSRLLSRLRSAAYQAFAYEHDPYGLPTLTADHGGNGVDQTPTPSPAASKTAQPTGPTTTTPTTGTWTQCDTLDNPLSPQDANRYTYAGGHPINNTDPTGQKYGSRACVGAAFGFYGSGITFVASLFTAPSVVGIGVIALSGALFIQSAYTANKECEYDG